jgi:hypothetical protein
VIADPLSPRAGGGFGLPAVRRQEINHEISPATRIRRARRDHGLFLNADADRVFGAEEVLLMIA